MHLRYGFLLAACFFLAPARTIAQPRLVLTTDPDWYVCNVSGGPGSFTIVHALLKSNTGATGVAFAAPFPANSGYSLHAGSPFSMTGDLESGVDISFGECLSGPRIVMQFMVVKETAGEPCTFFGVKPHPAYGAVTYTDCFSVRHELKYGSGVILNSDGTCDQARPPYDPLPPPGAPGVDLETQLEWSFDEPDCCTELSGRRDALYFGTTPDPPMKWDAWAISSPYPIGPLEPATTYYWMIVAHAYGCAVASPVWSFTTTDKVAVKPGTWGSIKALYR